MLPPPPPPPANTAEYYIAPGNQGNWTGSVTNVAYVSYKDTKCTPYCTVLIGHKKHYGIMESHTHWQEHQPKHCKILRSLL